jgi:adenylate kinase family enzyme
MSIYKKITGNGKANKTTRIIRKSITAARAAVEVYIAIKKKDPMYVGMSLMSTYEALEMLFAKEDSGFAEKLEGLGLKPILRGMERFVFSAFAEMELPQHIVADKSKEAKNQIVRFDMGADDVFFIIESNTLREMYCKDEDYFIKVFSNLLIKKLGQNISVMAGREDWSTYLKIQSVNIPLDVYVSTIDEKEYYRTIMAFRKRGLNRSSLLFGPPGCGKTSFAAKVTSVLGGRLAIIDAPALNFAAEYGLPMEKIFRILSPTVVLFDDIDKIADRHLDMLLGTIESLNRYKGSGELIIIGSVNDLSALPAAMRRPGRFDEIILFDYPTRIQREEIIKGYLSFFGTRLANDYVDKMVELTKKLTPAYIREIALQASIVPFEKIPSIIEHTKKMQGVGDKDDKEKAVPEGSPLEVLFEPDSVTAETPC